MPQARVSAWSGASADVAVDVAVVAVELDAGRCAPRLRTRIAVPVARNGSVRAVTQIVKRVKPLYASTCPRLGSSSTPCVSGSLRDDEDG